VILDFALYLVRMENRTDDLFHKEERKKSQQKEKMLSVVSEKKAPLKNYYK
tara:strand:+ start:158 stop:310 length:153 start_codon:yes stop_codon:yes gene_type:complete